eukprot:gene11574-13674_t
MAEPESVALDEDDTLTEEAAPVENSEDIADNADNNPIVLDGSKPAAPKSRKRKLTSPLWDSAVPFNGTTVGEARKPAAMIQVNTMNPWHYGTQGKTWTAITTELSKHPACRGIESTSRHMLDSVTKWIDAFKSEDYNKKRSATGTDDEELTEFDTLLSEVVSMKCGDDTLADEGKADKDHDAKKKLADQAVATALLEKFAGGLATKEAARKSCKR